MPIKELNITQNELKAACSKLDVHIPERIFQDLAEYLQLLMRYNKAMNLVGAKTWNECLSKLLVDSFHVEIFLQSLKIKENPHTWDLGAGAGLPGIALRMVWQEGSYFLVEAREKRALFLQTVLAKIKLKGVQVFHGRAENFFIKVQNNPADLVISRAFMPWADVLKLVQAHIKTDTQIIFLALEVPSNEELQTLGFELVAQTSYKVDDSVRTLWAARKQAN